MKLMGITNGISRLFGGKTHDINSKPHIKLSADNDDNCELPKPLEIKNPSNPTSWYEGITKLLSKAQKFMACVQSKLTGAILGDSNQDPNLLRHFMFIATALIGKMYDLFGVPIEMTKQNKDAEKKLIDLAKPA